MNRDNVYDSIVIGAGHAGVEASLAIARSGFQVLLVTMNRDTICQMSCNPAIGGLAKGHMVRELDALGGEMGLATDAAAIQFRMLNKSKGPAVWAPRAQVDKKEYRLYMTRAVESEPNLSLKEAQVAELIARSGKAIGIRTTEGTEFYARTVVVTTGTFMRGLIHVGETNFSAGRRGEAASIGFSESLRKHGFEIARFKTGTPCRVRKRSIDFTVCEEQAGDVPPEPFSFRTETLEVRQMSCWLTHTNEKTHEVIRKNLHRSPLYSGRIKGTGPRYCPSIEDKVVKFADKKKHQVYLEPEGRDTDEYYLNGLSTSLPVDVQVEFLRTIPGLEYVEIIRFGYAIEYDCMPPTQLRHSLETKKIENLFFAGQVNCTSGYEEAAAQGLMAGLNVVRKLRGEPPFVLSRSEAYIGVLIDDLVTRGTEEPYRMFTSRAEFRLLLRQDNADKRLMKYGRAFGLISTEVYERIQKKYEKIEELVNRIKNKKIVSESLDKIIRHEACYCNALQTNYLDNDNVNQNLLVNAALDLKYEGYIRQQQASVEKFKKLEKRKIPISMKYESIAGFGREALEKLNRIKPDSIGQASRIPGITSSDIALLLVAINRVKRVSRETNH